MGGIEGAEWIGVVIMAFAVLAGVLLVVSAHGDMKVKTHYENNDDEEAADVMVDLIQRTSWRLVVHDDGNDTPASIYNNERVINALDERMAKRRWLQVRCLFNYKGQPLKFLRLIDKYGAAHEGVVHHQEARWRHPLQDCGRRQDGTSVGTQARSGPAKVQPPNAAKLGHRNTVQNQSQIQGTF